MASEREGEKRETLAEVVATMRRGTKLRGFLRSCDLNEILAYHADRIEAAWKRERESVTKCNGFGNAAAMREALVELTDKVLDYLHKGLIQLPLPLENATAKARAALTAPARNCDRFNNPEDAYEAWKKECNRVKNVNGGCRNCPYDTYKADSEKPSCVDMFLFAPAAERKGEGDGR